MISDALIRHTVIRFPDLADSCPQVEPLEKGGSDRRYYRVKFSSDHSLILVKYGSQREENRHYVSIARFLAANGIRVPEIYFHDETEGLIWMQDLGADDLWSFRGRPWPELCRFYHNALDEVLALHERAHQTLDGASVVLQAEFNEELYLWEQNYFFENCLGRLFQVPEHQIDAQRQELGKIAKTLAQEPRVLVHRDFQSQNIMVKGDQCFLIDFQGLRPGLAAYDLASLVYDPYVALTQSQRHELLGYYRRKSSDHSVQEHFELCALQRLMQALGAYGFLGLVKGRPHFLEHVPSALASLRLVTGQIPQLQQLHDLLAGLPDRPCILPLEPAASGRA